MNAELIEKIKERGNEDFFRLFPLVTGMELGRGKRCRCKYHSDKRPSGSVRKAKSGMWYYHCYPCDLHLNIVDLVAREYGTDFLGAVELLADMVGIDTGKEAGETKKPFPVKPQEMKTLPIHNESFFKAVVCKKSFRYIKEETADVLPFATVSKTEDLVYKKMEEITENLKCVYDSLDTQMTVLDETDDYVSLEVKWIAKLKAYTLFDLWNEGEETFVTEILKAFAS